MSDDRLDERLQDYLDDRLSGPEKAAFEKRLTSDPDLASRLEAYRSVGRALRETSEELAPGFYARARERFETARAPRSGWRFLLRWEAIGVAAAGLLLVAVMLPDLMRGKRMNFGAPTLAPTQESVPVRTLPPIEDAPAKPQEQEKLLQTPGVDAGKDAPLDKRGGRRRKGAEEPREALEAQDALTEESFAPAPPLPDTATVDDDEAGENVVERDVAAGAKRKEEKDDAKKSARLDAAAGAAPTEPAAPEAEREQTEATGYYGRIVGSRKSGIGIVAFADADMEIGSVVVVDDEDAWNQLPVGVRGAVGRPDFLNERLVLIGPRGRPVRCASLEVVTESDRVVIRIPPAAGPGDEGCAVTVAADGRRVEVVDLADPNR
jgi:anti-sigma factor RsiW